MIVVRLQETEHFLFVTPEKFSNNDIPILKCSRNDIPIPSHIGHLDSKLESRGSVSWSTSSIKKASIP